MSSDRVTDHGDYFTIDVADLAAEVVEHIRKHMSVEFGLESER